MQRDTNSPLTPTTQEASMTTTTTTTFPITVRELEVGQTVDLDPTRRNVLITDLAPVYASSTRRRVTFKTTFFQGWIDLTLPIDQEISLRQTQEDADAAAAIFAQLA